MTTLERAEKALRDEVERQVQAQGSYSGPKNDRHDYVDADLDYSAMCRAVLMAVREPGEDIMASAFHDVLEPVYPTDFTRICDAILAEGE